MAHTTGIDSQSYWFSNSRNMHASRRQNQTSINSYSVCGTPRIVACTRLVTMITEQAAIEYVHDYGIVFRSGVTTIWFTICLYV
jgi:hypothetical protein